jgi:hypothetical protein
MLQENPNPFNQPNANQTRRASGLLEPSNAPELATVPDF